ITAAVCIWTGPAVHSSKADSYTTARNAIYAVFGAYAPQAMRVAWCESRYQTWAQNGQYLGMFQMGARARALYGHGPDAWSQARAAWRYFVAAGHSWSPWTCRP